MWKLAVIAAFALAAAGPASAQTNNFQLPRECSERHNVDQSKCVIQDGQPSYPWVHKVQPVNPTVVAPAPAPAPVPAAAVAPRKAAR